MTPSEQLDIGYANEMMALANQWFIRARRMAWVVYIGLAGHVGFVLFWAGLQSGWWQ